MKKGDEMPLPMGSGDGTWYKSGGKVNHNNKSYLCILSHTSALSNQPPNTTYWQVIPYRNYPAWTSSVYYAAPAFLGYNQATLYTYMFIHPNNSVYIDQVGEGYPQSWVYTTALTRAEKSLECYGAYYGRFTRSAIIFDWAVTTGSEVNFNPGSGTQTYRCVLSHTASSGNQPPNTTYWTQTTYSGTQTAWAEYTNYQEDSPGPNQSDPYNKWQVSKSFTDTTFWAPYITNIDLGGGVIRKAVYYANRSLLFQSGEPQTRQNAAYLWNFDLSRWDNIYTHNYRRNKPIIDGGWGPIIEYDDVSWVWGTDGLKYRCKKDHINATADTRPISGTNWYTYWVQDNNSTGWYIGNWVIDKDYFQKKYIKELGYKDAKMYWSNDGGSGDMFLTDIYTTWDPQSPNWTLFRRTPNYTYGMGNSTDE